MKMMFLKHYCMNFMILQVMWCHIICLDQSSYLVSKRVCRAVLHANVFRIEWLQNYFQNHARAYFFANILECFGIYSILYILPY